MSVSEQWRGEIAQSVERTLLDQARANEALLARLRAVTLSLVAIGDWVSYAHPPPGIAAYPLSTPAITTAWAVASNAWWAVCAAGWYRPWVRSVAPVVDGVLCAAAVFNLAFELGPDAFRVVNGPVTSALACAVLASTGALRLTRFSAAVTVTMAMLTHLAVAVVSRSANALTVVHLALLLGIGLLGIWMTDIVRRVVEGEVGRSTLRRFVPATVVDGAFATSAGLEGLTRPRSLDVTIVVTDLRGFTSAAETMTPEEALGFLNEVQGRLAAIVLRHAGTVDKFLGDGMLAVFGAPEPVDDHAGRALAAVAEMLGAMEELDRTATSRVKLGVGVHSGTVVAGCLGTGGRLEFTVIGDTVNTASRLEALTKEKGVAALVSVETQRRTAGTPSGFQLRPLGDAPIRGRREPLGLTSLERG